MPRIRARLAFATVGVAAGALLGIAPSTALLPAAPSAAAGACEPGTISFIPDAPPALAMLQADVVGSRATGKGVLVAIVDSGIDVGNPHLAPVVEGGVDLVGDGERADGLSDLRGHGTAIAGVIAAAQVPGSGLRGLAPDARLFSVRVFRGDDDESVEAGFGPSVERMAEGIRVAVDRGATVINVSMSDIPDDPGLAQAVEYARAHGSLVVASGGNRSTSASTDDGPRYPGAYPGALAVGAADAQGQPSDASIHGPHIDVIAPGQNVLSAATGAGDCVYSTDFPASSFATAYASAAAALVAEAHPEDGPDGWIYRLSASAARADLDARDDAAGWGLIQPYDAITMLPDASTRGPESPFFDTSASAVRPAPGSVVLEHRAEPFVITKEFALVLGILAAAVLGSLGAFIVFRRQRDEPEGPTLAETTGGLLTREVEAE
ncbi:peptidase S8 [Agromyces protaetiae]|uniref:Peptidase S8 n=1 Tax=Agromyces protaetiae TaxID=2509455 RepID=A0A4P6FAZ4_9MICO|nr:S8 family serine peptidase [Agromyces protaetiae]QAY72143.1 peptidase S8 [Agromyces protaetiae]